MSTRETLRSAPPTSSPGSSVGAGSDGGVGAVSPMIDRLAELEALNRLEPVEEFVEIVRRVAADS